VDRQGIPLGVQLSAANRHDMKMLQPVLNQPIVPRPHPSATQPQHACLDKGYDYPACRRTVRRRGYIAHIPHRGQDPSVPPAKRHPARRWVVERTNRWHNLFRRLKIRYEVHTENYLGFVEFASAIICFRACRGP
jgi:putative transposase